MNEAKTKILCERVITDCKGEGCEDCDICRYLSFLEWANQVAPSGSTIERNAELDEYLSKQAKEVRSE